METIILLLDVAIITALLVWVYKLKKKIQELSSEKRELQHDAEHDMLTGLVNGTILMDRLNQSMKIATRYKKKIAVFYLNIDHFGKLNDSLGTNIGDEFLQILAKELVNNLRQSDTVARIGGDEFIMILDNFDDSSFIKVVLEKVMQISKTPFNVKGHEINATFSIGVSVYPDDDNNAQGILYNASLAMRDVKKRGRDKYRFYKQEMA